MSKNWERIQIECTLIEATTNKAVLIKMPNKSGYKGYNFWHPRSCCRSVGKNGYYLQISFTDEFNFKLKKHGKGKFNFNDLLDEKNINSEELKKAFGFGVNEQFLEDLQDDTEY